MPITDVIYIVLKFPKVLQSDTEAFFVYLIPGQWTIHLLLLTENWIYYFHLTSYVGFEDKKENKDF